MTVWFTSDQHFGHKNILFLGDGRPFDHIGHHNRSIVNNWQEVVAPEDTVYVLGDIAMGDFEQSIKYFTELPGNKMLVPGNHDKIFSSENTKARVERFTSMYEEVGFTILPENTSIELETSWGIQEVLISHFPYTGDSGLKDRYAKNRYVDNGLPIIHGHTHSRQRFNPGNVREFHVGVDANDFTPVSENDILLWLEDLKVNGHI